MMPIRIDATGCITPLKVNQVPFFDKLTADFGWIDGFQECEKLQTETIPNLKRQLSKMEAAPIDCESLQAWINAGYAAYLDARITAIAGMFALQAASIERNPRHIADYLAGEKIPPFVTKDELLEAVKRFSAGRNGISEKTRTAEIQRIRDSLRSAETALLKKSEGFMVRPIRPHEQDITAVGGLVDMRRVFVESWREVQSHTGQAVGPQGYPLHLSTGPIREAHAKLGLDRMNRRRHAREVSPAAVHELRPPKIV